MESVLMAPGLFALRDRLQRPLPLRMHREATRLYDLLLTTGVSPGDAQAKVAELYSPPRVTVECGHLPHLSLKGGSTFDLRADANGKSWDFRLLEHRSRARAQIAVRSRTWLSGSAVHGVQCSAEPLPWPQERGREAATLG